MYTNLAIVDRQQASLQRTGLAQGGKGMHAMCEHKASQEHMQRSNKQVGHVCLSAAVMA